MHSGNLLDNGPTKLGLIKLNLGLNSYCEENVTFQMKLSLCTVKPFFLSCFSGKTHRKHQKKRHAHHVVG